MLVQSDRPDATEKTEHVNRFCDLIFLDKDYKPMFAISWSEFSKDDTFMSLPISSDDWIRLRILRKLCQHLGLR